MRCDIIIPVWNQPGFTKDCVNSVIKHTTVPYRLILIDNGSDDETKRCLESLKGAKDSEITVVRNEENTGFVKAVNQGIALSTAPCACVLNNDTLVTKDWLRIMMEALNSSADVGIVNPSSNTLGQRPADGEPLESYAEKLKALSGRVVELGAAIGFCMLIKREVIEKIGAFDEIYGMGNFEDTDFSRRAMREGYKSVRACGAYVFHREKASFGKRETFEEDFKRNREIYEFRWGRPKRIAYLMNSYDDNLMKRLNVESLKLARGGNWVWYISGEDIKIPEHSNILRRKLPAGNFRLNAIIDILKKKKRYDQIFVGDDRLGKILGYLFPIHRSIVGYY